MEEIVKNTKARLHLSPKPRRLTSVVLILLVVCGVMSAMFAAITADLRSRDFLRGRAQTIANALPTESVAFLEGEAEDTKKFEYIELKRRLERIQADNRDLRHVYLMTLKDKKPVYLVDALPGNNADFSAPGTVYEDAPQQLMNSFGTSEAFIEGPFRDQWGTWISAFAPVIDPITDQTVALVGTDTPALNYYFEVLVYALVPLCLAAIPLAGLLRDRKLATKEWEITQLKNQFVSIASHELRSPLSGMVWAIQSLLKNPESNLADQQKALLQDMFKSAEASTATINEILDLSVFERGQTTAATFSSIDVVTALREVQKTLSLGAQEKKLRIVLDKTIPIAATTSGDINALRRAFMNLISNSIKYAFEGTEISLSYRSEDNQHIFAIADKGIGIPKDEQDKVIGGYYRAKNASKVQAHGTGLGLWITRLIIEEHGGKLWLESEEDKGTTMYVSLPKVAAFTESRPSQEPQKSVVPPRPA